MPDKNILFVNKPPGPTSHDLVDRVRKMTGEKRVGHAGTLDPFAEGLLIVLVGREATKRQGEFMKLDKEYIATLCLGAETDTGDKTGKFKKHIRLKDDRLTSVYKNINLKTIRQILRGFTGKINQIPPEYSAIKIKGKRAYEFARRGEVIKLEPRKIKIYSIKILKYHPAGDNWPPPKGASLAPTNRGGPILELKIKCSSGTYIRSLARDIGRALGCGAYVEKLIRTKIGKYSLKKARDIPWEV